MAIVSTQAMTMSGEDPAAIGTGYTGPALFGVSGKTNIAITITQISSGAAFVATVFTLQWSTDGVNFVPFATPKTVTLSSSVRPPAGGLEPFDFKLPFVRAVPTAAFMTTGGGGTVNVRVFELDSTTVVVGARLSLPAPGPDDF